MISLEGRIARIEATLCLIFTNLPKFIRDAIDEKAKDSIRQMAKDAEETIRLKRDTN